MKAILKQQQADSGKAEPLCRHNHTGPALSIPTPDIYRPAITWLSHAWQIPVRATSWHRRSPGHSKGYALDVAPDIPHSVTYAAFQRRDPLLTNRERLMAALADNITTAPQGFLFFVETDHVHIAIVTDRLLRETGITRSAVFRWAYLKESVYPGSSRDWYNGRKRSPLLPEDKMNKAWLNKAGIDAAGKVIADGQAVVNRLVDIHKSLPKLDDLIKEASRSSKPVGIPAVDAYVRQLGHFIPETGGIVRKAAGYALAGYLLHKAVQAASPGERGDVFSPVMTNTVSRVMGSSSNRETEQKPLMGGVFNTVSLYTAEEKYEGDVFGPPDGITGPVMVKTWRDTIALDPRVLRYTMTSDRQSLIILPPPSYPAVLLSATCSLGGISTGVQLYNLRMNASLLNSKASEVMGSWLLKFAIKPSNMMVNFALKPWADANGQHPCFLTLRDVSDIFSQLKQAGGKATVAVKTKAGPIEVKLKALSLGGFQAAR